MASLGDLVVNLSANSQQFTRKMNKARGVVSDFALAAAAAGTAAVGLGLVKLAADAETLEVKFRTLLGSAAAAQDMMRQIGDFAASTPFQQLDIAGAAQKLLAFNVPAGEVMDRLQNIGDISALTGNSIGELAELYGKAHVQGRLFMEDINQLTGRGIPIIQELAEQFGVAESEVRNLVSSGQVAASNISQAFSDMTAAGGQFHHGMQDLSKTTAGRFSTLRDNVELLGRSIGQKLLPLANQAVMVGIDLVQNYSDAGEMALKLGAGILAASVAMRTFTAVTQAAAKATAVMTALAGPKGMAQALAGLAAATAVMVGVEAVLGDVKTGFVDIDAAANKAAAAFDKVTNAAPRAGEAMADAVQKVEPVLDRVNKGMARLHDFWKDQGESIRRSIETPGEELRRLVDVAEKLRDRGFITDQEVSRYVAQQRARLLPLDNSVFARNSGAAAPVADPANRRDERQPSVQFAGFAQRGSADAFAAVVRSMQQRPRPELKEQKKTNKLLEEIKERQAARREKIELRSQGGVV